MSIETLPKQERLSDIEPDLKKVTAGLGKRSTWRENLTSRPVQRGSLEIPATPTSRNSTPRVNPEDRAELDEIYRAFAQQNFDRGQDNPWGPIDKQ